MIKSLFPEVDPHHVVLHLPPEEHRRQDSEGTRVRQTLHFFPQGGHHDDVGGALIFLDREDLYIVI